MLKMVLLDIIKYNISPNSAALRKADGRVEAHLIQIACSPCASKGHSRWTLRLLEERCRVEIEAPVSRNHPESLKKNDFDLTTTITGVSHQRRCRIYSLHGRYLGHL